MWPPVMDRTAWGIFDIANNSKEYLAVLGFPKATVLDSIVHHRKRKVIKSNAPKLNREEKVANEKSRRLLDPNIRRVSAW